ncbi:MAG: PadR family transcriptional regulator [Chloroflexota bacterium]
MNFKGSLPLLILQILSEGPNHGYQIGKLIRERSNDVLDFREGTLYPALRNLNEEGLISIVEGERGRRRRRSYRLTDEGARNLMARRQEWVAYVSAVESVLASGSSER